jgi:AcrR family transcriptional regulator
MSRDARRQPAVSGLRERHKTRTHTALRNAALELYVSRGFDATTVEDVAAAADVSPRTFFRYFATKSEVVVAPYLELFDRWEAVVLAAPTGRPLLEVLQGASHLVTDAYEQESEFWDRHHQAVTTDPDLRPVMLHTQAHLQERATTALARRLRLDPRSDLRPRILAAAAMAATGSAVAQWYAGGQRGDRGRLIDAAYGDIVPAAELLDMPCPPPATKHE